MTTTRTSAVARADGPGPQLEVAVARPAAPVRLVALPARPVRRIRAGVLGYVALTKPRIIELLLVTTVPAMMLAARGVPPLPLVGWTLLGGSLAAASANALNCYLDRDIDRLMHRTSKRPLVTGVVSERGALVFGLVLAALAAAVLGLLVNPLSAVLALGANAFYVVVYTMILKRRTPQNIVWGGIAGCAPTLVGWTAVTGRLAVAPFVLFGIVFLWTPPHYWPLSLRFRSDYAAAGIPMLPVVSAPLSVSRQVVIYAWAMVGWSLLLVPLGPTGWVYAATAAVAGGYFLVQAHRLLGRARRGEAELSPMSVFHASISYLSVLFLAVAIDPLVHLPM